MANNAATSSSFATSVASTCSSPDSPRQPREPVHAVVNAGTGEARTFKAVAEALMKVHGLGKIEYIPFPGDLKTATSTSLRPTLPAFEPLGTPQDFRRSKMV